MLVDGDLEDEAEVSNEAEIEDEVEIEEEAEGHIVFPCEDSQMRCNGTRIEQCSGGEWMVIEDCADSQMECYQPMAVTRSTASDPYCVPVDGDIDDEEILENEIEMEAEGEGAWEAEIEGESDEQPTECSTTGETQCNGDMLETCYVGSWQTTENCGLSGGTCDSGPPATCLSIEVCTEGETKCEENVLMYCLSTREWDIAEYCDSLGGYCDPGPPATCMGIE